MENKRLITVIDDDSVSRRLIGEMIAQSGLQEYDIAEAGSLNGARTYLEQPECEVILLDLDLPDSKGFATLQAIIKDFSDKVIIVVSGNDDLVFDSRLIQAGAQDYLVKGSFSAREIEKTIRHSIERKKTLDAWQRTTSQLYSGKKDLEKTQKRLESRIARLDAVYQLSKFKSEENLEEEEYFIASIKLLKKTLGSDIAAVELDLNGYNEKKYHTSFNEETVYVGKRFPLLIAHRTRGNLKLYLSDKDNKKKLDEETVSFVSSFAEHISSYITSKKFERERLTFQMQLLHSQKMQAVGTLAAGVAHEINTPMQFISDNTRFAKDSVSVIKEYRDHINDSCQLLRQNRLSVSDFVQSVESFEKEKDLDFIVNEVALAVDQLMDGVERVTSIVSAMSNFSKINAVEGFSPVDIYQSLKDTVILSQNTWNAVADVEIIEPESEVKVVCDGASINQVFMNVLLNSVDSIKRKGVIPGKITVSINKRERENLCSIVFMDNGEGVKEENMKRIFDPFFTTKTVGEGSGQGLSVAHAVLDHHNGRIWCESKLGDGASIFIELPMTQSGGYDE